MEGDPNNVTKGLEYFMILWKACMMDTSCWLGVHEPMAATRVKVVFKNLFRGYGAHRKLSIFDTEDLWFE